MVDIEKLRAMIAKAKSKSGHPEDVASARYQLKEWSMSAALPALLDELERKTKALEAVQDFLPHDHSFFAESVREIVSEALKGTPND